MALLCSQEDRAAKLGWETVTVESVFYRKSLRIWSGLKKERTEREHSGTPGKAAAEITQVVGQSQAVRRPGYH